MRILTTLILFAFIIFLPGLNAQNSNQKPTRQTASDAFSKGNYESAASQFEQLSASFPKDPQYKYYFGVCLVKLSRNPEKAASLLKDAVQSSGAIRSIPSDGLFYLGKAQQMSGKYSDAVKSFNRFTDEAGKKSARDLDVPELIKQCNERKGKISEPEPEPEKPPVNEVEIQKPVVVEPPKIKEEIPVRIDEPVKQIETKIVAEIPPDTLKAKPDTITVSYDLLLQQAIDYQFKSDSLRRLVTQIKENLGSYNNSAKDLLKTRIQNLEGMAQENQALADSKMAEAQKISGKPENTKPDTVRMRTQPVVNIQKADTLKAAEKVSVIEEKKPVVQENKQVLPEIKPVIQEKKPVEVKDTTVVVKEKPKDIIEPGKQIYSVFEIKDMPVYAANDKVNVNPSDVPAGLIFRIQVAVFKNPVAPSFFKGINPVYGFRNETTGVSNYYAGMFRKSGDAALSLAKVKSLGFKDAFVVALMDKKVVSAERAALLEKEWGTKPLFVEKQKALETPKDTIPPTLVFRVEVARSAKPLPADQTDNIKKMGGTRGFEMITNEAKQNIYLIGKFLSYKSAMEFADLLVRNGFKDAKVVAYLGNREIPVETARQLFEGN